MATIDAIILAGGEGTRLRNIVADIPKPLAPVCGRPFLDILLSQLNSVSSIARVVLAVGYKADIIIDRYRDSSDYNFKILFSEEKKLLGTGGAIKKALFLTETHTVLILNGDSYVEVDIDNLVAFHKTNNASITIVLKAIDNASRYGRVKVDKQNRILLFEEKLNEDSFGLINTGMYVIEKNVFTEIGEDKKMSFETELLPVFIKNNAYGYIVSGRFIDIGIPDSYKVAEQYLA